MELKFKDETGNEKSYWLDKNEYDYLRAFKHHKEVMLGYFGGRLLNLIDTPITLGERQSFNKLYSEKYPEYAKILHLLDIEIKL